MPRRPRQAPPAAARPLCAGLLGSSLGAGHARVSSSSGLPPRRRPGPSARHSAPAMCACGRLPGLPPGGDPARRRPHLPVSSLGGGSPMPRRPRQAPCGGPVRAPWPPRPVTRRRPCARELVFQFATPEATRPLGPSLGTGHVRVRSPSWFATRWRSRSAAPSPSGPSFDDGSTRALAALDRPPCGGPPPVPWPPRPVIRLTRRRSARVRSPSWFATRWRSRPAAPSPSGLVTRRRLHPCPVALDRPPLRPGPCALASSARHSEPVPPVPPPSAGHPGGPHLPRPAFGGEPLGCARPSRLVTQAVRWRG